MFQGYKSTCTDWLCHSQAETQTTINHTISEGKFSSFDSWDHLYSTKSSLACQEHKGTDYFPKAVQALDACWGSPEVCRPAIGVYQWQEGYCYRLDETGQLPSALLCSDLPKSLHFSILQMVRGPQIVSCSNNWWWRLSTVFCGISQPGQLVPAGLLNHPAESQCDHTGVGSVAFLNVRVNYLFSI